MHRFLRGLTHPDQTLAHFNDTADDIAPSTAELAAYALVFVHQGRAGSGDAPSGISVE